MSQCPIINLVERKKLQLEIEALLRPYLPDVKVDVHNLDYASFTLDADIVSDKYSSESFTDRIDFLFDICRNEPWFKNTMTCLYPVSFAMYATRQVSTI